MASNEQNDSFVTFYPVTSINIIKVSKQPEERGLSFENEMELAFYSASVDSPTMSGNDILLTQFQETTTDARYFPPEDAEGSTVIYTVYRKQPDDKYYKYLYTLKDGCYTMKDYNVKSNHYYHYMMTVEQQQVNSKTGEKNISYNVFESADEVGANNYYRPKFDNWTICNVELSDADQKIYTKTGKTWYLGLNMQGEAVTKNLNINTQDTLSRYPKVTIGKKNYDSMQFSTLLGRIHQYDDYSFIGESNTDRLKRLYVNYPNRIDRYTEKMDTYNSDGELGIYNKYATESDKLEAWKEFICDGEMKLVKDIKGNSWIVQISDSTDYAIEMASNLEQTQVSFSWNEIMDANDISIITEGDNT